MNLALIAATALPFVISPGASFTITINAATTGDRRAPLKVWAGTSLGIVLIAGIAGFSGFGELIAGSNGAQTIFGVTGGAVLIALGVTSLIKTLHSSAHAKKPDQPDPRLALWAFLAVITNVKALSLYALVVPTLHGAGISGLALFLVFAAVHVIMLLFWLGLIGEIVKRIPALGASKRARTILLLLTAATLILLGSRTLIDALF